jgi:ABC-type dipeptide/oligopeptide/nickel transport system ATPase component
MHVGVEPAGKEATIRHSREQTGEPLLSVDVSVDYPGRAGVLRDVAFSVAAGEILALVGESGSGKSTLALALLRLLDWRGAAVRGSIVMEGSDLLRLGEGQMRAIRGARIGFVPQSPLAALNPALSIERHFREAWAAHASGTGSYEERVTALLAAAGAPAGAAFRKLLPRQLSVGLAQRVLIALALLHHPPLLLADEPTSALDVIHQAEIIQLFAEVNRSFHTSILYVSHDLLSVAALSHRVAILRDGRLLEIGPTEEVFCRPSHAYTRQLLQALPRNPF